MSNLINFCKEVYKNKPKPANTIFLRFPMKKDVKELFTIIKEIFLYGFSDGNVNKNSFKITQISLESLKLFLII